MIKELIAVKDPKMSAKMLCEYAEASPLSRTSIIRDCKFNKPFISARYNEAEDFVSDFLSTEAIYYPELIKSHADALKKMSEKATGMKKDHLISSSYALNKFYEMRSKIKIFEELILRAEDKHRKIIINGVKVSIRPEIMVCDYGGLEYAGFIKLYFGKTKPLTETVANNIACLGKHYFTEVEKLDFKSKNCYVVDVCAGKIYTAPSTHKRIMAQLNCCCLEIADRWEKIESD